MHEIDTGRAVANPRRTRLGSDWTPGSSGRTDRSQPDRTSSDPGLSSSRSPLAQ